METQIQKYFTLESAVKLIPFIKETFDTAYQDLAQMQDDIVLYKRLHNLYEKEDSELEETLHLQAMGDVLQYKYQEFEARFHHWIDLFAEEGILVKDFRKGLVDFPYLAQDGTEYLLCWHMGEDGLFYFHGTEEGFTGRKPITFLPD